MGSSPTAGTIKKWHRRGIQGRCFIRTHWAALSHEASLREPRYLGELMDGVQSAAMRAQLRRSAAVDVAINNPSEAWTLGATLEDPEARPSVLKVAATALANQSLSDAVERIHAVGDRNVRMQLFATIVDHVGDPDQVASMLNDEHRREFLEVWQRRQWQER